MRILNEMNITVAKSDLLEKLRANRETHAQIVVEARKGYVDKAKRALAAKLDKLESGEIVSLAFTLRPPLDYTDVYDTAIGMLEMDTGDSVALSATQFRCMVMDEWDWKTEFVGSNAAYSDLAKKLTKRPLE